MLSEFIFSLILVLSLFVYMFKLKESLNNDYEDLKYFNKGIHKYFKEAKCLSGFKCSANKLVYKNLKINIKNYNEKNIFIEVQDEFINKIYKKLEEKNINIGKQ